jgi:hypothetical protein
LPAKAARTANVAKTKNAKAAKTANAGTAAKVKIKSTLAKKKSPKRKPTKNLFQQNSGPLERNISRGPVQFGFK